MYFKHHNKKKQFIDLYQISLNLKILRIRFCEILYYIASFLSKINNVLFSWLVSRSPLCEFSGSVLVFWQHCGKYVTDFATYGCFTEMGRWVYLGEE